MHKINIYLVYIDRTSRRRRRCDRSRDFGPTRAAMRAFSRFPTSRIRAGNDGSRTMLYKKKNITGPKTKRAIHFIRETNSSRVRERFDFRASAVPRAATEVSLRCKRGQSRNDASGAFSSAGVFWDVKYIDEPRKLQESWRSCPILKRKNIV